MEDRPTELLCFTIRVSYSKDREKIIRGLRIEEKDPGEIIRHCIMLHTQPMIN